MGGATLMGTLWALCLSPLLFFNIKDLFVLFERQIYGEEETDLSSAGCNDQS